MTKSQLFKVMSEDSEPLFYINTLGINKFHETRDETNPESNKRLTEVYKSYCIGNINVHMNTVDVMNIDGFEMFDVPIEFLTTSTARVENNRFFVINYPKDGDKFVTFRQTEFKSVERPSAETCLMSGETALRITDRHSIIVPQHIVLSHYGFSPIELTEDVIKYLCLEKSAYQQLMDKMAEEMGTGKEVLKAFRKALKPKKNKK